MNGPSEIRGESMSDQANFEHIRKTAAQLGAHMLLDPHCVRFRDPALGEALEVWRAIAGDGIPKRRDMTPKVMRPFLNKVALMERLDQPHGTFRYRARLTGQEFTLAYAEMSGKFFDEVVPKKYLARWKQLIDGVLSAMQPLRCLIVPEAFNRDHSVLEMLLAPLLDDDGKANQILFVGKFERGASWAAVAAEEQRFLDGVP